MWKLLSLQQPQLINHLWDNSLRYQVTPGPILPSLDKKLCSALQAEQFAALKCSGFLYHPFLFPKPCSRLLPGKIIEPTPTFQEMFICLPASNDEEEAPPACRAVGRKSTADSSNHGLIFSSLQISAVIFITPVFPRRKLRLKERRRPPPGSATDSQETCTWNPDSWNQVRDLSLRTGHKASQCLVWLSVGDELCPFLGILYEKTNRLPKHLIKPSLHFGIQESITK